MDASKRVRVGKRVICVRAPGENEEEIAMTPAAAFLNATIKIDVEERMNDDDEDETGNIVTVIPNTTTDLLRVMVRYCERRALDPAKPIPVDERPQEPWLDAADVEMCSSLSDSDFFRLLELANYLGNDSLIEATAAYLASQIVDKTPAEIRARYKIEETYTTEQEEFVRANTLVRGEKSEEKKEENEEKKA